KAYSDPVPLFQRYGAEDQLTAMYDPVVQLKSGGYIVINPTEALVSIDINSGRSTKEHGIEATALNTNLEAAREIARQLRLRDMAGLVVIDFIDMEYGANVRKVEKTMKDALKNDRARIQVGRISSFGLMEMSRQRLRTGVLEATTRLCPHCDGSGLVRTAGSAGLSALRMIEEEAAKGKGNVISLYASQEATIYVLNAKRADLAEIEARYGVSVEVIPEGENEGAKMRVGSSGPRPEFVPRFEPIAIEEDEDDDLPEEDFAEEETEEREEREERSETDGEGRRGRGRKRRRGRGRDREDAPSADEPREAEEGESDSEAEGDVEDDGAETSGVETAEGSNEDGEGPRKRRRRGRRRRGGRNRGEEGNAEHGDENGAENGGEEVAVEAAPTAEAEAAPEAEVADAAPVKRPRRRKPVAAAAPSEEAEAVVSESVAEAAEEPAAKPKRTRRKKVDAEAPVEAETPVETAAEVVAPPEVVAEAPAEDAPPAKPKRTRKKKEDAVVAAEPEAAPAAEVAASTAPAAEASEAGEPAEDGDGPRRGGWWQRTFGA
ncbi:MAG: ribonuclease, partial [Novosphingobium sp.]|nr:ribonuclease [Novosphingobium sp.]